MALNLAVGAAIVAGIAFFVWVLWPVFRRKAPPIERTQHELFADAMLTEKHYVYASIIDLDNDLNAGKIDANEHQRLREALLKEASRLLAQIDELESSVPSKGRKKV